MAKYLEVLIGAAAIAFCLLPIRLCIAQTEIGSEPYLPMSDTTMILSLTSKAEKGDAQSQAILGGMYLAGGNVPQDIAKAEEWLQKAVEQNNAPGMFGLGSVYLNKRNMVLAHLYFKLAVIRARPKDIKIRFYSLTNLQEIVQFMSSEDVEEAQRLTREWLSAHPEP